ncbi:MAG: ABC transporter substrate-binding protein [Armatimonadota bacterium]
MSGRLVSVMVLVALVALVGLGGFQPARAQREPIRIGAIIPLTGPSGVSGQAMQKGYQLALEEINRGQGLLGRRVELIVEDDRGDPPTGSAAFLKLSTRDRIDVLIGGLQSSVSIAVASQVRQRPILMAWTGAASTIVERLLADADWFFHYHPWEYHNTDSTFGFVRSTGAKTIALAHEDGPFGSGSADQSAAFAKNHGLSLIFQEGFKSGSPDLTPLLTKSRSAGADVFLFVSFDQDVVPMATQARQVGFAPKLILAAPPSWPVGFEKLAASNHIAGMALWTAENSHAASRRFVQRWRERFNEEPSSYWGPLAYTNLITVADAIRRAGGTDINALVREMKTTEYEGPIGLPLTFKRSIYGKNQGFTKLVAFQWQNGRQVVVWPTEIAGGRLAYPGAYGR